MTANKIPADLYMAQATLADPGDAKTIVVNKSLATCDLVSATAETRTLGRPTKKGVQITLHMKTDGGDITLTVTGGFNELGTTTFVFSDPGQFITLLSFYDGTSYYWRKISDSAMASVEGLTATGSELNTLHNQTLTTTAGAGFTGGTGTVYKNSVQLSGGIYKTTILVDLTGLASSTTDLDIIGVSTTPAHLGQITVAQNGTLFGGLITCLEVPTGGVTDIDMYWATEATGKFDDAISGLTETVLLTNGGAWTLALMKAIADPVGIANGYLYLTGGTGGTAATYTAGKFLIELYGV
jgi:hypothetical protein